MTQNMPNNKSTKCSLWLSTTTCALKKGWAVTLCNIMGKWVKIADLSGNSVGNVGLHCGDVLLWVINRDKKVTGFSGGIGVASICFQFVIQLQPVEQGGRRGGARRLHWSAVSQPRFLRWQIWQRGNITFGCCNRKSCKQRADRLMLMQLSHAVNGAVVETAAAYTSCIIWHCPCLSNWMMDERSGKKHLWNGGCFYKVSIQKKLSVNDG